jgi:hypothetical protein
MKQKEKKSATQEILKHLQKGKKLTALQAMQNWGIMSLSSQICKLRERGADIKSEQKKIKTRFGHITFIAEYSIGKSLNKKK